MEGGVSGKMYRGGSKVGEAINIRDDLDSLVIEKDFS